MRIAYIAAGAAGMYCGSCLHDNTLARALMDLGHDVLLVPTYTPIRTDEVDVSQPRVFVGGISSYLQQKMPLFRYTPRWVDRLFDQPWLLKLATRGGPSVDPAKLGDMTVSMLRGESGNQRKGVVELVDWLVDVAKPDVVHLSNSMLLGFAKLIAERCGPPVVCSLSGEDIFLEKLTPPYYQQARDLIRERAGDVAAFVSLNEYYANFMSEYLAVAPERMHVVPHGLDLAGHGPAEPQSDDLIVGYLARICHDKGLHLLIEACEHLAETAPELHFKIQAVGYLGKSDQPYLADLERRIANGPLAGRFEYLGELDRDGKLAFLKSLSVFSLPTVYAESKGLPVLEAWANGVPVVLPDHGSFSEMVADTSGGMLHVPHDPVDLAGRLAELLVDADLRKELGTRGHAAVVDRYHAKKMAETTLELYRSLL
ncbi:glycosyltransferase family 4 protein [Aeoliella mucimassa]|uniref:2-deoxystreptamine glucosyltransferase n=1 Tax=Aeoliella mucimassa TaxID=2527972 RepID=A0A518AL54_9BACT|nr:glycosyltransferase family 4 protein [Aeoliella mucimassa]QDU55472.1 2-deoxystreptamine glucosyltransferase [Aeoliella mucimassa]